MSHFKILGILQDGSELAYCFLVFILAHFRKSLPFTIHKRTMYRSEAV